MCIFRDGDKRGKGSSRRKRPNLLVLMAWGRDPNLSMYARVRSVGAPSILFAKRYSGRSAYLFDRASPVPIACVISRLGLSLVQRLRS